MSIRPDIPKEEDVDDDTFPWMYCLILKPENSEEAARQATTSQDEIVACERESVIQLSEKVNDVRHHFGGLNSSRQVCS